MKHLKLFEDINPEDIMSYDTKIKKFKNFPGKYTRNPKEYAQDVLSLDTDLRNNDLWNKAIEKAEKILTPYYNYIRSLRVDNLTPISYYRNKDHVGFEFIFMGYPYTILVYKQNIVAVLIGDNEQRDLIPIKDLSELKQVLSTY